MRHRTVRTALLCAALASGAGCFSLGRETPLLEQYVLGAAPAPALLAGSRDLAGVAIGLRRLDLAPYLASPAIVVRRGSQQIIVSEFRRWSEDPAEGINRAVARYLATVAPLRAVDVAPWAVRAQHDYLIQLRVSRFEGVTSGDESAVEGEAHMLAAWEISQPQDGLVVARGTTDYRARAWKVGDYAGLVTLLDGGLSSLATDLAACLGRIVGTTPVGAAATGDRPSVTCATRAE